MSLTQGGGRTPQRQRVSRWASVFPPKESRGGPGRGQSGGGRAGLGQLLKIFNNYDGNNTSSQCKHTTPSPQINRAEAEAL